MSFHVSNAALSGFTGLGGDVTGEDSAECLDDKGSGGMDQCIGYEWSCPDADECCSSKTWYNRVYGELKGRDSLQWKNEDKVYATRELLLAPSSGFDTGMEQYAYDQVLSIDPKLVAQTRLAYRQFAAALPFTRWERLDQGVPSDCQTDGWYSQHRATAEWPDTRFQAITELTGIVFTPAVRTAMREIGDYVTGPEPSAREQQLIDWFTASRSIIAGVPGGRPNEWIFVQPRIQDLLSGVSGVAQPSEWLKRFNAHFGRRFKLRFPVAAPAPPPPVIVRPGSLTRPGTGPGRSSASPTSGGRTALTYAAGAVAVGAVAYLLLR